MDEVAGSGCEGLEALGAGDGERWVGRSFDSVDEEVVRADVVGVAQDTDCSVATISSVPVRRLAVGGPKLPWVEIHQAFGVEGGGVEVVRMLRDTSGHRFGVALALNVQVVFGVFAVAVGEGVRCSRFRWQGRWLQVASPC